MYFVLNSPPDSGWAALGVVGLLFIPLMNIVVAIIVLNELSKSFGKSLMLGHLFYPILVFGSAKYERPAGGGASATAVA